MTTVLETQRLILRELQPTADCDFVIALLNSEGWLKYIGERNVRTQEQAQAYIALWLDSYAKNGFGLWAVVDQQNHHPIGLCGLIRRDRLPHVDIGFAFLPEYIGKGFAKEAALATLRFGFERAQLDKIIAITLPNNTPSRALLKSIGLHQESEIDWDGELLLVYGTP